MTDRKDWLKKAAQARQEMDDDETPAPVEKDPSAGNVAGKSGTVEATKATPKKRRGANVEATKEKSKKIVKNPGSREGKSANLAYTQVSAYVLGQTYTNVKIELLREGKSRDFSDLVEELLSAWLKKQKP